MRTRAGATPVATPAGGAGTGPIQFPEGFLWGTASAAHQVEGAVHADGRGPSIWDTFSHTPGKTTNGDTGDVACDQFHRYEDDFDLMAELGFPAYRPDFLGVNYYTDRVIAANPESPGHYRIIAPRAPALRITPTGVDPPAGGVTAMGWQVAPRGMTEVLVRVRDEYTSLPLYVTEIGAAYDDYVNPGGEIADPKRIAFLDSYPRGALAAIEQGVDLRGPIIWCFQDNFASTNGYSRRFGLVWTDFATQQRIPKQSTLWYGDAITRNGLAASAAG